MIKPQLPLDKMMEASAEAAEFMRLFATPSRLILICFLAGREASVGEIQEQLGFKQPALSQQLAELRQAGVVQTRRESRQIYYSIADQRVARILDVLLPIFCGTAEDVQVNFAEQVDVKPGALFGEMAQWATIKTNITPKTGGSDKKKGSP